MTGLGLEVLIGLLYLITLLPLSRNPHWLVRSWEFPRLQLAVLAGVLVVAQAFMLTPDTPVRAGLLLGTVACLCWHGWWILPYTPLRSREVLSAVPTGTDNRLGILASNVLTSNRNSDRLLDLVRTLKPDLLVTLESDSWWQERLDVLETEMPHTIKCPLDNLYGMHVYSRLPMHECEVKFLVEPDKPSMHAQVELRDGRRVRIHFLHPAPPSPTENEESAERDAELIMVAKSVSTSRQPVIVAGDLNDVAWSSTTRLFRKISGLLDPRVGRGMFNTYHAGYPFMRWPLDHLFHSDHFTLGRIERMPSIGSDHFPLYTVLYLDPRHRSEQNGPEADEEDEDRSRSIAQKKGVNGDQVPEPGE